MLKLEVQQAEAYWQMSRRAICGEQSCQESLGEGFSGQVDRVAASAEAGTEAGQEYCEDSALYELD